jgi:phosphoribosylanthranilate isomerase
LSVPGTGTRDLSAVYRIKICGIVHEDDISSSVDAGADALGFLVGITHRAEDSLSLSRAARLMQRVPGHIRTVLVTHRSDPELLIRYVRRTGCRALQIQADITVRDLERVRRALPRICLIKALLVEGGTADTLHRYALERQPFLDAFLCDTADLAEDRIGGTGRVHDWSLSRRLVDGLDRPVLLAGGLSPGNVIEAVRRVRPWGVDVNSGVEASPRSRAGRKDRRKLLLFGERARQALGMSDDL